MRIYIVKFGFLCCFIVHLRENVGQNVKVVSFKINRIIKISKNFELKFRYI